MQKPVKIAAITSVLVLVGIVFLFAPRLERWRLNKKLEECTLKNDGYSEFAKLVESRRFSYLTTKDLKNLVLSACSRGRFEIVKLLHERGTPLDFISDEDDTPLLSAAYATSSELLRYLIKNGGDVNYENKYGHSALLNAVLGNRRQSVEIATILLDSGVKPFGGMANPYPFKSAVENKNTNMIALFLSRMTNVNFTADEQKEVIEWDKWDADGKIVTLFLSNYFAGSFQQTNTAP